MANDLNIKQVLTSVIEYEENEQSKKKLEKSIETLINKTSERSSVEFGNAIMNVMNAVQAMMKKLGKEQIDIGALIALPQTDALNKLAQTVSDAIADGISNGMAQGVIKGKRSFLKATKDDISPVLNRRSNAKGQISKKDKVITSINEALNFKASSTISGATRQMNTALQEYNNILASGEDHWEAQYAAMLKYIEGYKQLKALGTKEDKLTEYSGKIEGFNFVEMTDIDVNRISKELRASLTNIFRQASGETLIENIDVEFNVPNPIKPSDATGAGDGKITIPVEFEIDKKQKLKKLVDELEEAQKIGGDVEGTIQNLIGHFSGFTKSQVFKFLSANNMPADAKGFEKLYQNLLPYKHIDQALQGKSEFQPTKENLQALVKSFYNTHSAMNKLDPRDQRMNVALNLLDRAHAILDKSTTFNQDIVQQFKESFIDRLFGGSDPIDQSNIKEEMQRAVELLVSAVQTVQPSQEQPDNLPPNNANANTDNTEDLNRQRQAQDNASQSLHNLNEEQAESNRLRQEGEKIGDGQVDGGVPGGVDPAEYERIASENAATQRALDNEKALRAEAEKRANTEKNNRVIAEKHAQEVESQLNTERANHAKTQAELEKVKKALPAVQNKQPTPSDQSPETTGSMPSTTADVDLNDLKAILQSIVFKTTPVSAAQANEMQTKDALRNAILQASKYANEMNAENQETQSLLERAITVFSNGDVAVVNGDQSSVSNAAGIAAKLKNLDKTPILQAHTHPLHVRNDGLMTGAQSFSVGDFKSAYARFVNDLDSSSAIFIGNLVRIIDLTDVTEQQFKEFNTALEAERTKLEVQYPKVFAYDEKNKAHGTNPNANVNRVNQLLDGAVAAAAKTAGITSPNFNKQYDITNPQDLNELVNCLYKMSTASDQCVSTFDKLASLLQTLGVDIGNNTVQQILHGYDVGAYSVEDVFTQLTKKNIQGGKLIPAVKSLLGNVKLLDGYQPNDKLEIPELTSDVTGDNKASVINQADLQAILNPIVSTIKTELKSDQPKDKWALDSTANNILAAIKALKVIDTSQNSGQQKPPTQQNAKKPSSGTDNDGSELFNAKIETQYSNLSLLYTKLESAGKLTSDIEERWAKAWDSLGEVDDVDSFKLWREELAQIENEINEIAIANKDSLTDQKASVNQLMAMTKLYNQMSVSAERANGENLNAFYEKEAYNALVEQQRLLKDITLTQEQQAQLDNLEIERKRKIAAIQADKTDKANKAATQKQEKDNLRELLYLHEQLGEWDELGRKAIDDNSKQISEKNVNAIQKEINVLKEKMKLQDDSYAKEMREAVVKGRRKAQSDINNEQQQLNNAKVNEVKSLARELGKLEAKQLAGDKSDALQEVINKHKEELDIKRQSLNIDERSLELIKERAKAAETDRLKLRVDNQQIQNVRKDARMNKTNSALYAGRDALISTHRLDTIANPTQLQEVKELQNAINKLAITRDQFNAKGKNVTPTDTDKLQQETAEVIKQTAAVKELVDNYERLSGENSFDLGQTLNVNSDIKTQLEAAAQAYHGTHIQVKKYDSATRTLTYTIDNGNNEITEYTANVRKLDGALRGVSGITKKTESFFEGIGRKMKEVFQYFSGSSVVYKAFEQVKKGIGYVREIDLALTELKKVTNETEESYERFLDTASKTASKVGSTIKDIVSSTADWSRLGYSMEEAAHLAESTSVLLNVSEFSSIDEATSALTSTMQAFGYTANQSMDVVDVLNEIGNNFAVSSNGIATALQDSASALMSANNSYEEAVSLIAAANRVVQNPSEVGSALRTIALRLRGTSVSELEELGEDITGAVTTKSKMRSKLKGLTGVDILTDTGAFKSTYEVLLEISKVWESLTDSQRAGALELIAGKNRANVASALLTNTKDLEEAYQSAMEAEGSAFRENQKYMDSIQGRIDQFNNAVQTMWNNWLDSEIVKGFVDLGTILVQVLDQLGLIPTLLIAISGISMFKNKQNPIEFFRSLVSGVKQANAAVQSWMDAAKGMTKAADAMSSVQDAMSKTAEAAVKLTQAELEQKLTSHGLTKQNAEEIITLTGLGKTTDELTEKTLDAALAKAGYSKEQRQKIIQEILDTKATEENTEENVKNAASNTAATQAEADNTNARTVNATATAADTAVTKANTKENIKNAGSNLVNGVSGLIKGGANVAGALPAPAGTVGGGKVAGVLSKIPALGKLALVAVAIVAITAAVEGLTTSAKEAAEVTKQAVEDYKAAQSDLKSAQQTIKSVSEDYEKLAKGVGASGENISLTTEEYERYNEIANQIGDTFPELIAGYTDEGNAIIKLKGNVEALTEAYDKQAASARQNLIAKSKEIVKDSANKSGASFFGDAGFLGSWGKFLQERFSFGISQASAGSSELKAFKNFVESGKKNNSTFFMDSEATSRMLQTLKDAGAEDISYWDIVFGDQNKLNEVIEKQRNIVEIVIGEFDGQIAEAAANNRSLIDAYLENNTVYDGLDENTKSLIKQVVQNMDNEFITSFTSDTDLKNWINNTLLSDLGNVDDKKVNLAMDLLTQFNNGDVTVDDYEEKIKGFISYIKTLGLENTDEIVKSVKLMFGIDDNGEAMASQQNVAKDLLMDQYDNKVGTLTQEELNIIDDNAKVWGIDEGALYSWDQLKEKIEAAKEAAEENSATDSLSKITALEEAYNALGDAIKEYKEEGTATVGTLKDLQEIFGATEGFEDLYQVLATGEGNVEQAVTNVANAYIGQQEILSDLTEDEKQMMIARLQALGVTNAQAIINNRQTIQTELNDKLTGYNIDLSAYATAEEAKLAIMQAVGLDMDAITDENFQGLLNKYASEVDAYATKEEQKLQIAQAMAKEEAKLNKEAAFDAINQDKTLTKEEAAAQRQAAAKEYYSTIARLNSVKTTIASVESIVDKYYNTKFAFDFSGDKIGIGRDYGDDITTKDETDAQDKLDKLRKKYENKIKLLEAQQTYLENEVERAEAAGEQVGKAVYEEQIRLENEKIKIYEQELKALESEMAGVEKYSDLWYEYADAAWETKHNIQEATTAVFEHKQAITDLYVDAISKIEEAYDRMSQFHQSEEDSIRSDIEYTELTDQPVSADYYKQIIAVQEKEYDNALAAYESAMTELERAINEGGVEVGTEEWAELALKVVEAKNDVKSARNEIEKTNDELDQLYVEAFDKVQEAYDALDKLYSRRQTAIENAIEIKQIQDEDYIAPKEIYEKLIQEEENKKAANLQERIDLQQKLNDAVANGLEEGSEEWQRQTEVILDNELEIQENDKAIQKYSQSIKDIPVQIFERMSKALGNLRNLYSDRSTLMDEYMKQQELLGNKPTVGIYTYLLEQQKSDKKALITHIADQERLLEQYLKSGEVKVGDSRWVKMTEDIRNSNIELVKLNTNILETNKNLKNLYYDAFEGVGDAFGNLQDLFDDRHAFVDSYIDYLDAMGVEVPAEVYEEKIAIEKDKQQAYLSELTNLRSKLAQMEAEGFTPNDEEWVQAQAAIRAVEKAVLDSETAMVEFNKQIREIDTAKFEELQKRINDVFDELENVYNLVSDEDVATEDGAWTDEGLTALGLMIQKLELAKARTKEYQKEIDKLTAEYKSGAMSEQEYNDRLVELKNSQWDSINATEEAKDAIVDLNEARIDLVEEGIQKEIEAYQELIDLKKKELDSERDLYEFRKGIQSQTKEIASLERRIAAMSGSSDAATIAERTKLEAQLREARESLDDTYYSHAMDSQSSALDEDNEAYVTSKEDYIEMLRESLENTEQVVADTMSQVLTNTSVILGEMNSISSEYGVTLSDTLTAPWLAAEVSAQMFHDNVTLTASVFQQSIATVFDTLKTKIDTESPLVQDRLIATFEEAKNFAVNTFSPQVNEALQEVIEKAKAYDPKSDSEEKIDLSTIFNLGATSAGLFGATAQTTLKAVALLASKLRDPETEDITDPFNKGDKEAEDFYEQTKKYLEEARKRAAEWSPDMATHLSVPSEEGKDKFNDFKNSVFDGLSDMISNAQSAASKIGSQMNNIMSDANAAAAALDRLGAKKAAAETTGSGSGSGSGNNGDGGGGGGDGGVDTITRTGSLGQNIYVGSAAYLKKNTVTINGVQYYKRTVDNERNGTSYDYYYKLSDRKTTLDNRGQTTSYFPTGTSVYIKKHAKGTMGTTHDEWAITDEPWLGDELTMYATSQGTLSYMRAGSTVIPTDLTKELVAIGEVGLNGLTDMSNAIQGVTLMSNVINKPELNLSFDALVKAEHITEDTLPAVKKLVTEELDKFSRNLNYSLRRVGAK